MTRDDLITFLNNEKRRGGMMGTGILHDLADAMLEVIGERSDGALEFLIRCAKEGGRIVSSGDLTQHQIVDRQAHRCFFVEPGGGIGWAILPWDLTTDKDRQRELAYFSRDLSPQEADQSYEDAPADEISGSEVNCLVKSVADRDKSRQLLLEACKAAVVEFKHLGQALGELTSPEMVDVWNKCEAAIISAEAAR